MKKISKIKKNNNKYTIILSDNSSLSFYSDTLIKYNLLKPRKISDKELEEIINYNNFIEKAVSASFIYRHGIVWITAYAYVLLYILINYLAVKKKI